LVTVVRGRHGFLDVFGKVFVTVVENLFLSNNNTAILFDAH
jgi:hypothetical protein